MLTPSQLKAMSRATFKVVVGGPATKTRGQGMINFFDQLIDFIAAGGSPGGNIALTGITEFRDRFGESFDGSPQEFAQTLLVKFQTPAFSYLRFDGNGSQTLLVGTPFPAGVKSVSWATSNAGNVRPGSITLRDVTANTVLAANEPNDGAASVSTAGFAVTLGRARVYLISGVDTDGNTFSLDCTITGRFQSAFGYSASAGPFTVPQLLALGSLVLQDGQARTVGGVTAGQGQYTVYAWASTGSDDIAQVLQDGVDSIRGAFGAVRYATGANSAGAQVTMGYIVSNADGAFANSSLAFS